MDYIIWDCCSVLTKLSSTVHVLGIRRVDLHSCIGVVQKSKIMLEKWKGNGGNAVRYFLWFLNKLFDECSRDRLCTLN